MVQAGANREQIKQELITKAESFLAQWDTAETAFEDPAKEYTCKTFKGDDDINVILIKYKCAGLTEE